MGSIHNPPAFPIPTCLYQPPEKGVEFKYRSGQPCLFQKLFQFLLPGKGYCCQAAWPLINLAGMLFNVPHAILDGFVDTAEPGIFLPSLVEIGAVTFEDASAVEGFALRVKSEMSSNGVTEKTIGHSQTGGFGAG